MRILLVIILILLAGCGTRHYKQFDLADIKENQGVIIGKIDVKYNYLPFDTTGCKFCAGFACQSLLDDGYVFMSVEKGPLTQGRLSCSNPDISYLVESFEVGSDIVYFGNLIFTVIDTSPNPGAVPVRSTARTIKLIKEAPEDYYVDDFGKAAIRDFASWLTSVEVTPNQRAPYKIYFDVSVKDDMKDVLEVFRAQVKNKEVKVEKNIFNIKLEAEHTTVYR